MFEEFFEVLTDPAHILAEVTSHLIIESVLALFLVPLLRRYVQREHRKIDVEHGVEHD